MLRDVVSSPVYARLRATCAADDTALRRVLLLAYGSLDAHAADVVWTSDVGPTSAMWGPDAWSADHSFLCRMQRLLGAPTHDEVLAPLASTLRASFPEAPRATGAAREGRVGDDGASTASLCSLSSLPASRRPVLMQTADGEFVAAPAPVPVPVPPTLPALPTLPERVTPAERDADVWALAAIARGLDRDMARVIDGLRPSVPADVWQDLVRCVRAARTSTRAQQVAAFLCGHSRR
jgi:hypothetical protein